MESHGTFLTLCKVSWMMHSLKGLPRALPHSELPGPHCSRHPYVCSKLLFPGPNLQRGLQRKHHRNPDQQVWGGSSCNNWDLVHENDGRIPKAAGQGVAQDFFLVSKKIIKLNSCLKLPPLQRCYCSNVPPAMMSPIMGCSSQSLA